MYLSYDVLLMMNQIGWKLITGMDDKLSVSGGGREFFHVILLYVGGRIKLYTGVPIYLSFSDGGCGTYL